MPPVSEYLSREFQGCCDIRVTDQANTLHVATWLHRLDLAATYGRSVSISPVAEQYDIGPLLEYFLMPRTSGLTFEEVVRRVSQENCQDAEGSLQDLQEQ